MGLSPKPGNLGAELTLWKHQPCCHAGVGTGLRNPGPPFLSPRRLLGPSSCPRGTATSAGSARE